MNSRLFQEKAFGSIFIAKAGSVTQKDLFERCHFFYFYKLGEANSSWLTEAFCTVCAACISKTWFHIPFFYFKFYFCFGRRFFHSHDLGRPSYPDRAEVIWDLNLTSRFPGESQTSLWLNCDKAGHIIVTQSSVLSVKSARGNGIVMAPKAVQSLGHLHVDCSSFTRCVLMKTKRIINIER